MKISELFEMAVPTDDIKSKTYYHGTSDEKAGEAILKHGIEPGDIANPNKHSQQNPKKPNMIPVPGKVYLTPSLRYGQIYAIGGDIAGSEHRLNTESGYGYLFIVKGSDLADVQPDEDSIGELAYKGMTEAGSSHLLKLLADRADRIMTPNQKRKFKGGDYVMWVHIGKKLLKTLNDNEKIGLILQGAHVAHHGKLIPSEAWKIDLTHIKDLKHDGSNFFKIAERVR